MPIFICRNYTLPNFVGENTLLFCISYSGNTEEVLTCFKESLLKNAHIITVGSGGKLKDASIKNGLYHVDIPKGIPPRLAIGYLSIAIMMVLNKIGLITDKSKEIEAIPLALESLADNEIGVDVPFKRNPAKKIAGKLFRKFPVIYGTSDTTACIAYRWRSQLAENSKTLSSSHVLPEMNHNEIMGWFFPKTILKDTLVVILLDKFDHKRTRGRILITKEMISKHGVEVIEVRREESGLLARLFSLIYMGDYVSFYLAMLNNVDPTSIKAIDYLKNRLAKMG